MSITENRSDAFEHDRALFCLAERAGLERGFADVFVTAVRALPDDGFVRLIESVVRQSCVEAGKQLAVSVFDGGDVVEQPRDIRESLFFGYARIFGVDAFRLVALVLGGEEQVIRKIPLHSERIAGRDVDIVDSLFARGLNERIEHTRVVELLIYDGVEHLRYVLISLLTRAVLDILIPVLRHALAGKSLGEIFIRFAFYKFHKMHLAFKYAASGGEKYVVKSPEYVKNFTANA